MTKSYSYTYEYEGDDYNDAGYYTLYLDEDEIRELLAYIFDNDLEEVDVFFSTEILEEYAEDFNIDLTDCVSHEEKAYKLAKEVPIDYAEREFRYEIKESYNNSFLDHYNDFEPYEYINDWDEPHGRYEL